MPKTITRNQTKLVENWFDVAWPTPGSYNKFTEATDKLDTVYITCMREEGDHAFSVFAVAKAGDSTEAKKEVVAQFYTNYIEGTTVGLSDIQSLFILKTRLSETVMQQLENWLASDLDSEDSDWTDWFAKNVFNNSRTKELVCADFISMDEAAEVYMEVMEDVMADSVEFGDRTREEADKELEEIRKNLESPDADNEDVIDALTNYINNQYGVYDLSELIK